MRSGIYPEIGTAGSRPPKSPTDPPVIAGSFLLDRSRLIEPWSTHGATEGATMNVADWLRTLGLERYEATFRENDVGAELVPSLTADDLKELGVTSIGH